jgi:hypothetical protein
MNEQRTVLISKTKFHLTVCTRLTVHLSPISICRNFPAHVSAAESPSNISPTPQKSYPIFRSPKNLKYPPLRAQLWHVREEGGPRTFLKLESYYFCEQDLEALQLRELVMSRNGRRERKMPEMCLEWREIEQKMFQIFSPPPQTRSPENFCWC